MTESITRTSRSRRVVALIAWAALVLTAYFLMKGRPPGQVHQPPPMLAAFILSVFSAFVGVFAWLLFNPGRGSAIESRSLVIAAAATMFPPPIIGYCLLGTASPLAGWLALGLFLLCVIAILSHVPNDFFGVPRQRHSYFIPIPAFDRVQDDAMDPNAPWFRFTDLSSIVADADRPSLAPRAYLQRETPRTAPQPKAEVTPLSDVDDILLSTADIGLLDGSFWDIDEERQNDNRARRNANQSGNSSRRRPPESSPPPSATTPQYVPRSRTSVVAEDVALRAIAVRDTSKNSSAEPIYLHHNPESQYLKENRRTRSRQDVRSRPVAELPDAAVAANGLVGPILPPLPGLIPKRVTRPAPLPVPSHRDETNRTSQSRSQLENPESKVASHRQETVRPTAQSQLTKSDAENRGTSQDSTTSWRRKKREDGTEPETERIIPLKLEPRPEVQRERSVERVVERVEQRSIETPARRVQSLSDAPVVTRDQLTRTRTPEGSPRPNRQPDTQPAAVAPAIKNEVPRREADVQPASRQSQQTDIRRTKDSAGIEMVEGVMKVRFDKGQKRANLHVPFSPPLAGIPEVECECVGDEQLRLKIPVRQSYGIRIEARRSNTDAELETEVGFIAMCPSD